MDSTIQPGSSDPPVRDREVRDMEVGSGSTVIVKETGLKKGDQSWVAIAKDKKVLQKFDVEVTSEGGKNKVLFPEGILSDSTPLWEDFVVGKFVEVSPHIAKVHMVVNKIWSYGDPSLKVEVYDVDAKTMRFKIPNQKAREKVIRRGVWNVAGVPMIVKKWSPTAEEEKQEEEAIPMWVHWRNIPLNTFSWEALSFMTNAVGHPVRLHPDTISYSDFEEAKVFVKVDVSKTLPKEIDFTLEGQEFTAEFYYPWLPARCNHCEKWGHTEKVCGLSKRERKMKESGLKKSSPAKIRDEGILESRSKFNVQQEVVAEQVTNVADKVVMEVNSGSVGEGSSVGSEWAIVTPDKAGRVSPKSLKRDEAVIQISASKFIVLSLDEVEEGEVEVTQVEAEEENDQLEEEGGMEVMESDLLEDEILEQRTKEKEKSVAKKGGRKNQKTKTQEALPKGKRSSRRNL